jgi:hypothetical protein
MIAEPFVVMTGRKLSASKTNLNGSRIFLAFFSLLGKSGIADPGSPLYAIPLLQSHPRLRSKVPTERT